MRKLYIVLSVIKSVYLTDISKNYFHLSTCTLHGNGKKTIKRYPTVCAILWPLLINRGIFSDAVKIPCHKYEIRGLSNYFERGERGEGVFLKERF